MQGSRKCRLIVIGLGTLILLCCKTEEVNMEHDVVIKIRIDYPGKSLGGKAASTLH
jgi:hypothetical protein